MSNFINEKVEQFKKSSVKRKVYTIISVFAVISILGHIVKGVGGHTVPSCKDSHIVNNMIPEIINRQLRTMGEYSTKEQIKLSDIEEIMYNKESGFRSCVAEVAINDNGDIDTGEVSYDIAFTDKERTKYKVTAQITDAD